MAGFSYPSVLVPENWNKQKGIPPKSSVADALTSLKKAHGSLDTSLLDAAKLKTAEEVQARVDALNLELGKGVKSAADQAKNVVAEAKKAEAEFKKAKENSKETTAAAIAVGKAASEYASDVVAAYQSVIKELAPRLAKLEAQAKKDEAEEGEEEGEDPDVQKDRAKVGKMVETALKLSKTAGPTKPMKFVIGVLKKELYVFVAKSVSGSTATRIKKLMEAGSQSMTFYRGDCLFENKAHVFVGVNIPTGGFAVRIQKALIEQTGKKYKIKVRKPTGETDEAAGDDDEGDADDALAQVSEKGGKEAAKAGEVLARHKKLKPLFDGLMGSGGALANEVRSGLASFETNVRDKKFDEALKVLDNLEKSLRDKAKSADAAKGSKDEAAKSAKETADAAIDKAAKGSAQTTAGGASPKLASEWASARKNAVDGIEALAKKIQEEYRDEADQKAQVDQAVNQLRTLAGKLSDGLDRQLSAALTETDAAKRAALSRTAKSTLAGIAKVVVEDKLMAELDGNELLPDLKVVAPLKAKLREIATALG